MTPTTLPLRALLLGAALCCAAPLRAEAAADLDSCKLLTATDVNLLLGGKSVGKPSGSACTWTTTLNPRGLVVAALPEAGPAAERSFAAARAAAGQDPKVTVTDEPGLGDQAFAARTRFGIALFMLKQGRLLQLQYWAGGPGTAKDLVALRPVAARALAAY
jgi:hypothetical protein